MAIIIIIIITITIIAPAILKPSSVGDLREI